MIGNWLQRALILSAIFFLMLKVRVPHHISCGGEIARISIGYNLLIDRCRVRPFGPINLTDRISPSELFTNHNATFYVGTVHVQSVQPPQLREGVVYRVFPDGSVFYDCSVICCFPNFSTNRLMFSSDSKNPLDELDMPINMSDWSGIQYGFYHFCISIKDNFLLPTILLYARLILCTSLSHTPPIQGEFGVMYEFTDIPDWLLTSSLSDNIHKNFCLNHCELFSGLLGEQQNVVNILRKHRLISLPHLLDGQPHVNKH
uniref:ZP domain-containing protein n=1 Tax=Heterorhabditis bacteriophora TaxID=37862 RepID=A0A1I7WDY2_HETBA